jgi:hypothetical protein
VRAGLGSLALVAALAAGSLGAQERERRPGARPGREEAFRMIDAYVVSNLQESLGLTDEQFVKVLPLVKKLQTDRRGFVTHRRQRLQELRRSLASGSATEARVLEQLKALKKIESEEPAAILQDLAGVDAALTPMQQARFRVMEVEVEAKIRGMLARIREQRRSRLGPRGPSPEPDDDPPDR